MKISPAPNNYPSGTRPEAVGAGVQFATGPCLTSWVNEGSVGLGSGGLTMQNRNRQGGSVAFTFRRDVIPATVATVGESWGRSFRVVAGSRGRPAMLYASPRRRSKRVRGVTSQPRSCAALPTPLLGGMVARISTVLAPLFSRSRPEPGK